MIHVLIGSQKIQVIVIGFHIHPRGNQFTVTASILVLGCVVCVVVDGCAANVVKKRIFSLFVRLFSSYLSLLLVLVVAFLFDVCLACVIPPGNRI